MPFIGNSVQNQGFAPAVDYFNGDGTTVTFTLSRPVASVAQLTAVIENVIQNPASAFTVSGNQITFTSAPPSGTNNVWVEYTSLITQYNGISQDPSVVGDITASGGYLATGDFGNSYLDGTVVDYVTGMSRITTGPSDGITLYNGGTASRSALMTISSAGNVGVGITPSDTKLHVYGAWVSGNSTVKAQTSVALASGGTVGYGNYDSNGTRVSYFYHNSSYGAIGTATSVPMIFETNSTERMRIDSSGRVTTPYQPAFRAKRTIGAFTGAGVIRFDTADYNRGSYYNASNGVFTAPVSGAYLFCYNIETQGSGNNFLIRPRKNGSTIVVTEIQISTSSTSGFCYSLVVDMAANDTFDLYLDSGYTIYGNANYTFMSGCLLG